MLLGYFHSIAHTHRRVRFYEATENSECIFRLVNQAKDYNILNLPSIIFMFKLSHKSYLLLTLFIMRARICVLISLKQKHQSRTESRDSNVQSTFIIIFFWEQVQRIGRLNWIEWHGFVCGQRTAVISWGEILQPLPVTARQLCCEECVVIVLTDHDGLECGEFDLTIISICSHISSSYFIRSLCNLVYLCIIYEILSPSV